MELGTGSSLRLDSGSRLGLGSSLGQDPGTRVGLGPGSSLGLDPGTRLGPVSRWQLRTEKIVKSIFK